MTAPSPLATPEPWDLVVEGYVAENLTSFQAFAERALQLAPATGEVLDVAAGPGSLTLLAARTARHVCAVDFAPAMIAELRRRAAAAGVTNLEAEVADGQALPFADARFDSAYSMFGLIFFPDRARGLSELARVLRPGAPAVIGTWPPFARAPIFAALFGALRAELPASGDVPAVLGTADEITTELRAAGFSEVQVFEHEVNAGTLTAAELWRSFSRGGAPAVLLRRRIGEEAFAALSARVVTRIEQALGPSFEMRMPALLGVGRR
jgi:SAM-dependent methyltransferase